MRNAIEIVETLLHGVRTKDTAAAPLAPDVVLEGAPSTGKLVGAEVTGFLEDLSEHLSGLEVERHVVEGPYVATLLGLHLGADRVSAFVCFRLSGGLIHEIRPFFAAADESRT